MEQVVLHLNRERVAPVDASGRQSIMVRSMDADSRQGTADAPSPSGPPICGCQAAEKTQSSCPISSASSVAVQLQVPAAKPGWGAYLRRGGAPTACGAGQACYDEITL